MYVVTAAEMQAIDKATIERIGLPGVVLMENAGRGVVQAIADLAENDDTALNNLNVAVICGKGNNGGDGFVVARYLLNAGAAVRVYLLGKVDDVKGDARIHLQILQKIEADFREIATENALADVQLKDADVIVDAIFGTGFRGAPHGLAALMIERINACCDTVYIVSVDAPSGVDMSTAQADGPAVRADLTVTMALPKVGHLFEPGRSYTGQLRVVDIGVPPRVIEEANLSLEWLDAEEIRLLFPPRKFNSHKGDFGKVAIIAGSNGMTGAAALTCLAAMRIGAGLVKLGIPKSLNSIVAAKLTEVMTIPMSETSVGSLCMLDEKEIGMLTQWADVMAIGPGLSRHPETVELVWREAQSSTIPLVVDADGLNALAEKPSILTKAAAIRPVIITPHPGEMARLLKIQLESIRQDPIGVARQAARHFNCTVVLKTAPALIAAPDGHIWINSSGNPGLATGGSGDVLTGMIAGLLGQGFSPVNAARAAVFLHGLAADLYTAENSEYGLIAGDIVEWIPRAIRQLQNLAE